MMKAPQWCRVLGTRVLCESTAIEGSKITYYHSRRMYMYRYLAILKKFLETAPTHTQQF
jgi:hypothetical protein